MDSITLESRAKVNLFLEIAGKREDGFHEIRTWLQEISLCDELTMTKTPEEFSTLRSNDPTMPFGKRNLCIKAYEVVRENTDLSSTVEISLVKNIPLGSGLGGGSSNAACVIKGLNELYGLSMDNSKMAALAAKVGSDVPFFIYGGGTVARGRGERIFNLPPLPTPIWMVLVKPRISISSGNAYQWVKDYRGERDINDDELAAKIQAGDLEYILNLAYNAFEPIVSEKHPEIRQCREELESLSCLKVLMSGSGSAFYGICHDEIHAQQVASALRDRDDIMLAGAYRTV